MPRNKGFAGFEDKALSFKAACEAIQKEPVREARKQATAQRTIRPSGTASLRSVAPQPAVNQTQKAPAAPAKKSPREEYSQFYTYADKKDALDRKTAQLATDINNYAGNLGSNRSFYDRGRAISNEARQCIQELDGISCPSDQARSHLKELFVLINNRAVAMANAVVYSSQGRDPLSQFAEGRDAAIKYDTVNGDFEAAYNK